MPESQSDDDHDIDDLELNENEEGNINLTCFLFGNVNDCGELEEDIFDEDSKKHLKSLSRLGLGSFLHEVVYEQNEDKALSSEASHNKIQLEQDSDSKSPSAQDFSDINELAEEEEDNISQTDSNVLESEKKLIFLMSIHDNKTPSHCQPIDVQLESGSENLFLNDVNKRKLNTPLASMLPSKYANMDVRELFPEFRHYKVLRFSRLFGPGKASNLPQVWRSVKKRKKKRSEVTMLEKENENDQRKTNGWILNFAPIPNSDRIDKDNEIKFMSPMILDDTGTFSELSNKANRDSQPAKWRYGPAQLWYDMLDVPENGEAFDYGFWKRKSSAAENGCSIEFEKSCQSENVSIPDDAFLMVTQLSWEDDVVWNGEDIKHKVLKKLNSRNNAAGWVPSSLNRTAQTFSQPSKGLMIPMSVPENKPGISSPLSVSSVTKGKYNLSSGSNILREEVTDDTWYSIFPVENDDLVNGQWEDDIIWDADNMEKIPSPRIVTLDPNDENIILGIPDDIDPNATPNEIQPVKVKIPHPHVKKSRLLLGKAGVITQIEEESPPPPPKSPNKDPFNISNDEFYQPKMEPSLKTSVGGNIIQHAIPVLELQSPFLPTHMGPMKLRSFHRPSLKRYSHGKLSSQGFHPVYPLMKEIRRKAKMREQEKLASGGGEIFFMRTAADLTGKDGDLILMEYCEEHPPLLSQVSMCSKIKNYYKRRASNDQGPPTYEYGETAYAHTSPFLGVFHPGQSIQAIENVMYRAPIYQHRWLDTDFLIIRTRQAYYIREINMLYVVGQECPLYEVPGPNSKRANNFVRDFLQVFIYRLFWKSKDSPRRIKMEEIRKAFPTHSESSIRKRLKLCADFKRTGMDQNWWVIKPDFRLPTEDEIRTMVSPEQCCAYFSMIASEQRLKDAGYGEKFLFVPQDEDDEDMQLKMDDEIKVAPWNTSRAYIQAAKGKCLLQLTGPADPTGIGEGFSYVRVPNKPQSKEEVEQQPKRTVTGTDADLRRLSLNNAKALLRKFGVPEEDIKKLSRWEVIDVVRTLSTEKAKAGEEGMTKFSRGNRFSIAEHQERYKEECQRIFDLQNKVLASQELLSTDEGSTTEEDISDIEEMGKNIESMLSNKKTSLQLSHEREEMERKELKKLLMSEGENITEDERKKKEKKKEEIDESASLSSLGSIQGKKLKIFRTFRNTEGKEYVRVETVRRPAIIDAYVRIRMTKDEAFIKQFVGTLDEHQKEEMKKEKRRIQEQLRRIKRNQEKEKLGLTQPKKKKPKIKPDLKLKCGACGQVGHMRTNKACPLYQPSIPLPSVPVAMTEEQEDEMEKHIMNLGDEGLINVDGTKVKLSATLIKHAEELKRKSLLLKFPKAAMNVKKKRIRTASGGSSHCDYLTKHKRPANRRCIDPLVTLSTILESILNDMRELPDIQPFLFPVNAKVVPDYYKIVLRPMDLQTIRKNLHNRKYQSREDFLADVNQIVENSTLYNGAKSVLTLNAKRMLDVCIERLAEKEDRLMRLEKAINPLLDDDDQVALTYILDNILNTKIKAMNESYPFWKPVNRKNVKDYYNIIKEPMDLETIAKNIKNHHYHNRADFIHDIELIYENSVTYNGHDSEFSKKAEKLVQVCRDTLGEYDDHLNQLEENIRVAQEKALEAADEESLGTSATQDEDILHFTDTDQANRIEDVCDFNSGAMQDNLLDEDLQLTPENSDYSDDDDQGSPLTSDNETAHSKVAPQGIGYYQEIQSCEEGLLVDANYDPSEFLLQEFPAHEKHMQNDVKRDLQVSDSEEGLETLSEKQINDDNENDDSIWF